MDMTLPPETLAAESAHVVSKVLVLERDADCLERLKAFCETHDLVALRAQEGGLMAVLKSSLDLGGIFLAEDFAVGALEGVALARAIARIRPELPIFFRTATPQADVADSVIRATYVIDDLEPLVPHIAASIFSLVYPNAMVRGIVELSVASLHSLFPGHEIRAETPYIVRDRLIHGEVYTLIPLESNWCRGYMMLQTGEDAMRATMGLQSEEPAEDFRELNNLLGEATNLIWGAFKNRFIDYADGGGHLTQIPIVINHRHKYISFGSQDPQLCFRYALVDPARPDAAPTWIYQRFVFNLSWSPDLFRENQASVEALFQSGELELF